MDNNKKIISAVVGNIIALVLIVKMFTGETQLAYLNNRATDLQQKIIPLVEKGEMLSETKATLTAKKTFVRKLPKQIWRINLIYDVSGDEEIETCIISLEGKIVRGVYTYNTVNQSYIFKDGKSQKIKFDKVKDQNLIIE